MKIGRLPEIKSENEIQAGEAIRVGSRTLYLIVKTHVLRSMEGSVIGASISPFALLVIEPDKEYAYSISGEDMGNIMDLEELMKQVPALREIEISSTSKRGKR